MKHFFFFAHKTTPLDEIGDMSGHLFDDRVVELLEFTQLLHVLRRNEIDRNT